MIAECITVMLICPIAVYAIVPEVVLLLDPADAGEAWRIHEIVRQLGAPRSRRERTRPPQPPSSYG